MQILKRIQTWREAHFLPPNEIYDNKMAASWPRASNTRQYTDVHELQEVSPMTHTFEGSTLALQHYYDIVAVARKLPLITIYQANEQPFGRKMSVWMATYGDDIQVPGETAKRLDNAMMKNRAVTDPHILRVLDFGTSEGHSFVVTDATKPDSVSLRSYLNAHGPLQPWQALRLLEQLTGIVTNAHQHNFRDLCLSSDNIFVTDTERFEIFVGPLGIGLHRADILELKDTPVITDLMRHIPPWEYASSGKLKSAPKSQQNTNRDNTSDESIQTLNPSQVTIDPDHPVDDIKDSSNDNPDSAPESATPESDNQTDKSQTDLHDTNAQSNANTENSSETGNQDQKADSIQDLSQADISLRPSIPTTPEGLCEDVYAMAAIIYEALCGQHPYFSDDRDLCDAALTLVQGNPVELSSRSDVADTISDVVMETLNAPKLDSENTFLSQFAAACTEEERANAHAAEKYYLTPTQTIPKHRKTKKSSANIQHSFIITAIVAIICMAAAAFATYQFSHSYKPVDLFAIPEMIPPSPDGIDIVIAPRTLPPNTSIYLTATDGSLIRLGGLPFIYRKQEPGTKLNFVIADDSGNNTQVPVTVNSNNGLMVIPVDLNW